MDHHDNYTMSNTQGINEVGRSSNTIKKYVSYYLVFVLSTKINTSKNIKITPTLSLYVTKERNKHTEGGNGRGNISPRRFHQFHQGEE